MTTLSTATVAVLTRPSIRRSPGTATSPRGGVARRTAAPTRAGADQEELAAAVDKTLSTLSIAAGYDLWMLNRVADRTFTNLSTIGDDEEVPTGLGFPVAQTLCGNLLSDSRPFVTAALADQPSATVRAILASFPVRSYAGIVVSAPDGSTLGTLCGLSNEEVAPSDRTAALLDAYAFGIGEVLGRRLRALPDERAADEEQAAAANLDATTRLPDRRGWGQLLQAEERRARQLGEPSGVVVVDLGPLRTVRAVRRAVSALTEAAGPTSIPARLGGRQIGILCPGASQQQVVATGDHVLEQLRAGGLQHARVGAAARSGVRDLDEAWQRAERESLRAPLAASSR